MIGSPDDRLLLDCGRHALASEVSRGLDRAGVPQGAKVLVAVSGGADSTALLALCAGLSARRRLQPVAGHVDHGLRPDSGADAATAARAADALGVPFVSRSLGLRGGPGAPARARDARYEALAELAAASGAAWVAVAHHADDQAETLLLALARGAGLDGLGGMPTRRPLRAGIAIVRPCLRVRRAELRAACASLGLPWREDPGNERAEGARGRVRHLVLTELEALAPGCAARMARTAELARLGSALLESHVAAMRLPDGSVPRGALRGAPVALAATAVRLLAGDRLDDAARWQAAEASVGPGTDPRRFPLLGGGELLVDAHAVRTVGQGSSSEPLRHFE